MDPIESIKNKLSASEFEALTAHLQRDLDFQDNERLTKAIQAAVNQVKGEHQAQINAIQERHIMIPVDPALKDYVESLIEKRIADPAKPEKSREAVYQRMLMWLNYDESAA